MFTIDLLPVEQATISICATALSVFGSMALTYAARRFHIQITATQTAAFDDALDKALHYGVVRSMGAIKDNGWDHVETQNSVVALAANYAVAKFPDVLSSVGIPPTLDNPQTEQKLTDALQRALPSAFMTAAASPATPPTPQPAPIALVRSPLAMAA